MKYFMGKIHFVRRFIFDFTEIVKPLQEMINKDSNFKWTRERKEAFDRTKEDIAEALTLWSPIFDKDFILYIFCFDHSITSMLMQKSEFGEYFSLSFMSTILQGAWMNYIAIDTQAFVVFKVVKHF